MKRLVFALIVFCALSSFTNPHSLVGKWQVMSVGFENGKVVEIREKWISFSKNGDIFSGKIGRSATMEGVWNFNCPHNSITILFEEDESNNGEFRIKTINESSLVLKRDSMQVYLRKID